MIILVGASATGKTQVGSVISKIYNIDKVVTYTTRPQRVNEEDGKDYHFITKERFYELKEKGFFFETIIYNDNFYGTSLDSLKNDSYLILEPTGMKKYLNSDLHPVIFYLECDEEIRYKRMKGRKDSNESILKRIEIDKMIFTNEVKELATFIIDVSNKTVEEIAREIYELSHPILN